MGSIKICSFNARGLNSSIKRSQILYTLHKQKVSVVLFQETHFRSDHIPNLQNKYYTTWYHDTFSYSKSRGVSIAIHKSLPHQVLDSWKSKDGRSLLLKLSIYGKKYSFINLYVPNQEPIKAAVKMVTDLMGKTEGVTIMGGDFNFVPDTKLDTTASRFFQTDSQTNLFKNVIEKCGLIDIWRVLHPTDKDYSYFSKIHNTYHRLDFFLINQIAIPLVSTSEIGNFLWSDHAPIFIEINLPNHIKGNWTWKLNENLLMDDVCMSDIRQTIKNFIIDHINDETSPPIQWETLKCILRGVFIKHGSRLKKIETNKVFSLLKEVSTLQKTHKQNPIPKNLIPLVDKQKELQTLLNKQTLRLRDKNRARFYQQGNKPGRLLAQTLRQRTAVAPIIKIQQESGKITHDPKEIINVFQKYYSELYNVTTQCTGKNSDRFRQKIQEYIRETAIPMLSSEMSEDLEKEISTKEIQEVIKSLALGKSPGPDGYTSRFYKMLEEVLVPIMHKTFNSISASRPFAPQGMEAHITVIPKPEKDHTICGNYRPISLTNIDLRIYATIIANRLTPILPNYIHSDQVGFTMGREARDNTMKTITLMEYAQRHTIPSCLLSIDAEKAFDRVGWCFLEETLRQWGLGPHMLQKIMALYCQPKAKIRIGGFLSESILITNGTRQGCPLSPLLYVLVMEHLITAIRNNPDIQGIKVKDKEYKTAVYADDLLIYITNPMITIPNLIHEFDRYGRLSNFKVNYEKSEALNMSLTIKTQSQLRKNFPFRWQEGALKYLGIYIPQDLKKLQELNYKPIINKLINTMQKYNKKILSWMGRINVIKMDILPKMLYIFQTIPITPNMTLLQQLRREVNGFIWEHKNPRIKRETLIRTKPKGGVALPDFTKYLQAAHITRIVDWFQNANNKQWVKLEEDIMAIELRSLPWVTPKSRLRIEEIPTLVSSTLRVWDLMMKKNLLSSQIGPMTPLFSNPEFQPALESLTFLKWHRQENTRLVQTLVNGKLAPLSTLGEENKNKWIQHKQLQAYINTLNQKAPLDRPLTEFEKILLRTERPTHVLSMIYNNLLPEKFEELIYINNWEKELETEISLSEWERSLTIIHKLSSSNRHQERNYKIVARWYKCPVDMHKINSANSEKCWKCNSAKGTLSHMWYFCPGIWQLWSEVFKIYRNITKSTLQPDIFIAVLSMIPGSIKSIKKGILPYMLTATRTIIARKWRNENIPSIVEWVCEMSELRSLEEMIKTEEGSKEQFLNIWREWDKARNSGMIANYIK